MPDYSDVIAKLSAENLHTGTYITTHGDDWRFEHDAKCFMCSVVDMIEKGE